MNIEYRKGRKCELTKTRPESDGREAISRVIRRRVGAVGIVEGLEGGRPAEPESAKGAEDYEGERIADDELDVLVSVIPKELVTLLNIPRRPIR